MDEYIKREDALSVAYKIGKKEYDWGNVSNAAIVMVVEGYLRAVPATDVVERKTGAWVETYGKYGNFRHQCSECGEMFGMPFDFDGKYYPYKFCPNCGADMREEPDNV